MVKKIVLNKSTAIQQLCKLFDFISSQLNLVLIITIYSLNA